MKKSIIASLAIIATVLTLSGCGQNDTDITTDTMTETGTINTETGAISANTFNIDSCNTYIKVMNCMIEKSPADVKAGSQDMIDKLLVAWKQLTPEQLQAACDATMKVMTNQKDAIEAMGCEIE